MPTRARLFVVLFVAILLTATFAVSANATQQDSPTWQSSMLWYPSLAEAAEALAGLVNQVDATCVVDVDPVVATNGVGPEGAVYAFAVTWSCPPGSAEMGVSTWQSSMLWHPTLEEAGLALAGLVNQIDASCAVDVDPVVATNGQGPEGPVYAFAVTWAC